MQVTDGHTTNRPSANGQLDDTESRCQWALTNVAAYPYQCFFDNPAIEARHHVKRCRNF